MTSKRLFFVLLPFLLVLLTPPAVALDATAPLVLAGRDLRGMDLRGWDLSYADLEGADLRDADLSGATLVGARLRSTLLDGASLRGADLRLSDLTGASLRGTDLRDADLGAASLSPIAHDSARWAGAVCPDETVAGDSACSTAERSHAPCPTAASAPRAAL